MPLDEWDKQSPGHRCTEIFAFVAVNDEGDEGLVSLYVPDVGRLTLATTKRDLLGYMLPAAERVAAESNQRVVLRRYVLSLDDEEVVGS